jgi:hypothetical protein
VTFLTMVYIVLAVNALFIALSFTLFKPKERLKSPYWSLKWLSMLAALVLVALHILTDLVWPIVCALMPLAVHNWAIMTNTHYAPTEGTWDIRK